jgi:hypothetical protein
MLNLANNSIVALSISMMCSLLMSGQSSPKVVIIEPSEYNSVQSADAPPSAAMILEYDRALFVLEHGLSEQWKDRTDYLKSFDDSSDSGSSGEHLTAAKARVRLLLVTNLRVHQTWDEGPPISVEVQRAIKDLRGLRDRLLQQERK